jgi:hypothetical protein
MTETANEEEEPENSQTDQHEKGEISENDQQQKDFDDTENHCPQNENQIKDSNNISELVPKVKVKLEISAGSCGSTPHPIEPLKYGRRKRRKYLDENEEQPKRVKLLISAKRIHPGTKSTNILEPITDGLDADHDIKPDLNR